MTLNEYLTSIADAIREKSGETGEISAADFPEKILAIEASTSGNSGTSSLVAVKKTAEFSAGTGERSASVTFSELKTVDFAVVFGMVTLSSTEDEALISGYLLGTDDDALITVSSNTVTYTADPPMSTAAALTFIAIGEAA